HPAEQVEPASYVDELCTYPDPIVLPPDAALQHIGDTEFAADLANILVAALEGEGRSMRNDRQCLYPGQPMDEFPGKTIAEVLGLRIVTQVCKRQHGD